MSTKYSVDPGLLEDLDQERAFASSRGNSPARLKLGKGERALVRILPVNLLPDNPERRQWYARTGFHWHNQRPAICPRTTQPLFGGDETAHCPVCEVTERFQNDKDEQVRKMANMASAYPNWLIYCIVWETYAKGSDRPTMPSKELQWVPHEFWLKRAAWLELSETYKRSLKRVPEFGILNPSVGFDVFITKDNRGNVTLRREDDPVPLKKDFEKDFDAGMAFVDAIFAKIKLPQLSPSTEKQLRDFAIKVEDSLTAEDTGRGRGRSDVDEGDDEPRRGGSSRRDESSDQDSGRRGSSRRDPDDADQDEQPDGIRERRQVAAAPDEEAPSRGGHEHLDGDPEDGGQEEAPPPVRSSPAPRASSNPPPPTRTVAPPPAQALRSPAPRRAAPPPEDTGNTDSDDVPPETHDAAPPAEPEPTAQSGGEHRAAPTGRLSSALRNNIQRVAAR